MQPTRLALENFVNHKESHLDLPSTGIVVITGANSAGKTILFDAIAWAYWGKTLRGFTPDDGATVTVSGPIGVRRTRRGGRVQVEWEEGGVVQTSADTATKTQALLDRVLWPFDLWRGVSVFDSTDIARFTLASDAQRKRFVELLIGLDGFDAALTLARQDHRRVEVSLTDAKRDAATLAERVKQLAKFVEGMSAVRTADAPDPFVEEELRRSIAELTRRHAAGVRLLGELDARYDEQVARLHHLEGAICNACGQAVPNAEELRLTVGEALHAIAQKHDETAETTATAQATLERRWRALGAVEDARAHAEQNARIGVSVAGAVIECRAATEALQEIEQRLPPLERRLSVLMECTRVLGVRGLRAWLLEDATRIIIGGINGALVRLGADLSVQMPLLDGKMPLEVTGRGEYRFCSGGERRRIDLATIPALVALAPSHTATILLDEVFDALDKDGRHAAVGLLQELARDRVVLVTSHAGLEDLVDGYHVRVENGRIL